MRHATVYIDRQALRYNLNRVKQLAPHAKIVSMVKANAYGHGIKDCLAALETTDSFGVACLAEALEIRDEGYTQSITLIEGVFSQDEMPIVIEKILNVSYITLNKLNGYWNIKHNISLRNSKSGLS